MIDPERILSIICGVALLALVILSLALVSGVDWRRTVKYCRVAIGQQLTIAERRAVRYVGRGLWVWLLLLVAVKGW